MTSQYVNHNVRFDSIYPTKKMKIELVEQPLLENKDTQEKSTPTIKSQKLDEFTRELIEKDHKEVEFEVSCSVVLWVH